MTEKNMTIAIHMYERMCFLNYKGEMKQIWFWHTCGVYLCKCEVSGECVCGVFGKSCVKRVSMCSVLCMLQVLCHLCCVCSCL